MIPSILWPIFPFLSFPSFKWNRDSCPKGWGRIHGFHPPDQNRDEQSAFNLLAPWCYKFTYFVYLGSRFSMSRSRWWFFGCVVGALVGSQTSKSVDGEGHHRICVTQSHGGMHGPMAMHLHPHVGDVLCFAFCLVDTKGFSQFSKAWVQGGLMKLPQAQMTPFKPFVLHTANLGGHARRFIERQIGTSPNMCILFVG